mmetsp:Transcript_21035/g.43882  ORF Transcript_21035/g.43882 Transcript_21035/m.43882 type:complete len:90 (+) Transcript_21035:2384-2653(+)
MYLDLAKSLILSPYLTVPSFSFTPLGIHCCPLGSTIPDQAWAFETGVKKSLGLSDLDETSVGGGVSLLVTDVDTDNRVRGPTNLGELEP